MWKEINFTNSILDVCNHSIVSLDIHLPFPRYSTSIF